MYDQVDPQKIWEQVVSVYMRHSEFVLFIDVKDRNKFIQQWLTLLCDEGISVEPKWHLLSERAWNYLHEIIPETAVIRLAYTT